MNDLSLVDLPGELQDPPEDALDVIEFARPEHPFVGAIYRNRSSREGRLWEVVWRETWGVIDGKEPGTWRLMPVEEEGRRVRLSGIDEDGQTWGGMVPLNRTTEQLCSKLWEFVDYSRPDEARRHWPVMIREEIEAAMMLCGLEMKRLPIPDKEGAWLPIYVPRSAAELEHFFDNVMGDLELSAKGYQEGWLVVPCEVKL